MDATLKVKQFDLMKEFVQVIEDKYQVGYDTAIIVASACVRRGYSLKYLKEGIYRKAIMKLIDEKNILLPSISLKNKEKTL